MEKAPYRHIRQENPGGLPIQHQSGIQQDKAQGKQYQQIHGLQGRKARTQHLVVDVVAVGKKKSLAGTSTHQHHAHNVKAGNHKSGQTNHGLTGRPGIIIRALVHENKQSVSQDITQTQTTAIAHKELEITPATAIDIIIPEGQQNAQHGRKEQQIEQMKMLHTENHKKGQGQDTQAGSQTVNAVNQIDGIGDINHKEQSKRQAHGIGNIRNTKKSAQRIDTYPGKPKHQAAQNLHQKLALIPQTDQIVHQPHDIHQDQTGSKKGNTGQGFGIGLQIGIGLQLDNDSPQQGNAEKQHRNKTGTTQTGRRGAVYLTGFGLVEKFFLIRNQKDLGKGKNSQ